MADLEKAKREIRYAKSAADDRRWDLLEARLATIEAALDGVPDADRQPVLAEIAPLRETMVAAVRAEQAGRIEREIQRNLDGAKDDLERGGSAEIKLTKACTRLADDDAKQCLSPEAVARLQTQIATLQARIGGAAAPAAASTPAPATPSPNRPAPEPAKPQSPPPAPAPAPDRADPERARAIESELARILRFAADELASRPDLTASKLEQFATRVATEDARRHLAPATIERLSAEAAALRARAAGAAQAERVREIEDQIGRFVRQAESDLSWNERGARDMLQRASQRLAQDDVQQLLPADAVARFRAEIRRIEQQLDGAQKGAALARAQPILEELEQRVAGPIFDGSAPDHHVVAELEALEHRVRAAIEDLDEADGDRVAIEARLSAAREAIAGATAAQGRDEAVARLEQAWHDEQEAIAGWRDEAGDATYELPTTALAVRRLGFFLADEALAAIRRDHAHDAAVDAIFTAAQQEHAAALQRLQRSFDELLVSLETGPRPTSRFHLERPYHLAGQAGSDFEGTPQCDANVARAKALGERWQAEIDGDQKDREAKYAELSAVAAAAWREILPTIDAATAFDPGDPRAAGRTVLLRGIRNRIGWDFSGRFDFAIWVGGTPVVGNFAEHVAAAVRDACARTGLAIDDHTDWDAVLVVGGPGTIQQRFQTTIRDARGVQIGTAEEWRPVPCVHCTVVGLCAGPAAVGPPPPSAPSPSRSHDVQNPRHPR